MIFCRHNKMAAFSFQRSNLIKSAEKNNFFSEDVSSLKRVL